MRRKQTPPASKPADTLALDTSKTDDIEEMEDEQEEQDTPEVDYIELPAALATDGSRPAASPMGQIALALEEARINSAHLQPEGREAMPALIEGLWRLSEGIAQLGIAGSSVKRLVPEFGMNTIEGGRRVENILTHLDNWAEPITRAMWQEAGMLHPEVVEGPARDAIQGWIEDKCGDREITLNQYETVDEWDVEQGIMVPKVVGTPYQKLLSDHHWDAYVAALVSES